MFVLYIISCYDKKNKSQYLEMLNVKERIMKKVIQNIFSHLHYNSVVILTMTFLSLFALLLQQIPGGNFTRLLFSVYRSSPYDIFFYFRLFGHVLGHGGWDHYIGNFLMILMVGPMLEEKYGSKNLVIMILITALVTGLLNIFLFRGVAIMGASGIVFMFILLSSFVNVKEGKIPMTFILVIVIYLGGEIIDGIFVKDNASQFGHIIGGICGSMFGFLMNLKYKKGA